MPETFSTKVQHNELKLFLKINPYSAQISIGYFLKRLIVWTENSNSSLKHSMLLNCASSMVKSFQHLTTFFMSTWWVYCRNMQEFLFPQWLFEGRRRKNCCQMSWIGYFILKVAQKNHCEISISCIFLQFMKNVVQC